MDVDRYQELHRSFRWQVPRHLNIAEACCRRWGRQWPDAIAIRVEREDGGRAMSRNFGELLAAANRLSHALHRLGVRRGDRVAIVLPQCFEAAVAHMAIYQMGAVALPLTLLFGPEALAFRLHDSGAEVAIVAGGGLAALRQAGPQCPALKTRVVVGGEAGRDAAATAAVGEALGEAAGGATGEAAGAAPQEIDWEALLAGERDSFEPARTLADDPAVLIYTSGTTGPPKGALVPHRALIGNLSGFVCSQNWLRSGCGLPPKRPLGPGGAPADAVFWSPADWAWTGGLMDALLPSLYFGVPIVAYAGRFGPERAFELMQRHRVTNSFLFPTALKAMMKAVPHPRGRYTLQLRAVMSAGEAVGDAVFNWCRDELGLVVNEMFGQTEINYLVGNCSQTMGSDGHPAPGWPARPGSMGRAYPGHRVAVLDDEGRECPRGTPGDVALHRRDPQGHPDPIFFLGYWHNEGATRAKFTGDPADSWCRTGDTAVMDADGYLWYQGRSDDVFKAAGYRIGPSEIENCLVKHPAVANAAVVPKPDRERGALVKAYVVLAEGAEGGPALVEALQQHVRERLAPYEYPKEIEFIAALPMTTTGKVQRRVLRLQEEERARQR